MKKITSVVLSLFMILSLSACKAKVQRFQGNFLNTFDTVIEVVKYDKSKEEFDKFLKNMENKFIKYNNLFDIYHDYSGLNNIKTINDNAGKAPVKVDKSIVNMIKLGKEMYDATGRETNIAMGSVLKIWHKYREEGINHPEEAKLPNMDDLKKASQYSNFDSVEINEKDSTVFIKDSNVSLDVGALAKGYAAEIITNELKNEGYDNFIISAGGNIKIGGKPIESDRTKWGVGIQNPFFLDDPNAKDKIETIFTDSGSVVSSGDYERYYTVNGKRYSHLIDPKTLMPGEYFNQVTVFTQDSGKADFLSTTFYLMPYEKGVELAKKLGVEVMWVFKDKSIKYTQGFEKYMKSKGATSK